MESLGFVLPSIFSGISALFGGLGASQARKDQQDYANKAEGYLNAMQNLSNEQLLAAQQAKAAWENAFGSIQQNLTNYYKTMNPTSETARRFQALEQQYQQVSTRLNENLASRGLATSGIGAQAQAQLVSNLAYQKAEAEYQTPHDIAKQQMGYLSTIGMPQQQLNSLREAQALQSKFNTLQQGGGFYQSLANQASKQANAGMASVGQALGNAATNLTNYGIAQNMGLFNSPPPSATPTPLPQPQMASGAPLQFIEQNTTALNNMKQQSLSNPLAQSWLSKFTN